jgi:hypothetical protein
MSYDLNFVIDIPYDRNALAPPHLPILRCEHRKEAHAKQSRHPSMVAHAYYCCLYKIVSNNISHVWILCNLTLISLFFLSKQDMCIFFQWIDGPKTFDPQILLFPYDRNESSPLWSFKHWIPLPPNPPSMTDEEKDEASTWCVRNPPVCKCGYHAELVNPPAGLNYTPFFCCLVPLTVILDKRLYILLWSKYWVCIWHWHMLCFTG